MTHPQVLGQKFTPIRRFSPWKTHPFWPHIPNMTQYGSAPRGDPILPLWINKARTIKFNPRKIQNDPILPNPANTVWKNLL